MSTTDTVEVLRARVREHARFAALFGGLHLLLGVALLLVWQQAVAAPVDGFLERAERIRESILDPATPTVELRVTALESLNCVADTAAPFRTLGLLFCTVQVLGAVGYLLLCRRHRIDLSARGGELSPGA